MLVRTHPKYTASEIERRWLVDPSQLAYLPVVRTRVIEDRYIIGTHLRLRAVHETGRDTIYKLGKKYERTESGQPVVSVYLSKAEYESLRQLPAKSATELRQSIEGGCLDVYESPQHRFALFEIEFSSPNDAQAYLPPLFAGQEVTGVPEFTGHALASEA